jgi:predicted AlkP superfamily phosphohydrolase/phosphomutase
MLSPSDTGPAEVEAVLELIDLRFEAAARLLEREAPDFLHLTVFYVMGLQHYFFRDEPVYRAWKRIDENLGRFLDDDHDILVMSDHGTWHVDRVFYVNAWLAEHGYLVTHGSVDDWLRRVGVTRERALRVAKRLGAVDLLSRLVPDAVQRRIPWSEGVKRDRVLSLVDWEETTAVASNMGPVYVNAEGAAADRVRGELVDRLAGLEHPETADVLVADAHLGPGLYDGPYAGNAPDVVLEAGPNVHVSDAVGPASWYGDTGVWVGGNMPEGIYLFSGPSFRDGDRDGRARIVDLAPTLLHSMGVPVPEDVDGDVLDVFDSGTPPAETPVAVQSPLTPATQRAAHAARNGEVEADVENRLADLGYLE